ncbi:MAG: M23 family metallopeptidase [Leptolyngbya sp. SIO3F4]|nr:M23 family metallopeptidase [Leptolyngbya sp. SIO3F4]
MTTWIKETDHAFYLMEGNFYLEKIVKESRPEGIGEPGEKFIALAMFQKWLTDSGFEKPGAMVIAVGIGASEPNPMPVELSPVIEIINKPISVEVGEGFTIKAQTSKSLVGKSADLEVEVNGQFYLQTTDPANKPIVAADGTFQFGFRFSSPGNRKIKITLEDLSHIFEIEVKAVFSIKKLPSKVVAGEAFIISGTASPNDIGRSVQLFVNNKLQSSTAKVQNDGSWQFRFGLFSLGKRVLKVALGDQSLERPTQVVLRSLFKEGFKVPEEQLSRSNYVSTTSSVLKNITVTGGFMEPKGHSWKPTSYAIFSSNSASIKTLNRSQRNYGIDYVVTTSGVPIHNWYPGRVTKVGLEGGYGYRCHFDFFIFYELSGKRYPIKGAYAHANSFSVQKGDYVKQGQYIGEMRGTGNGGRTTFPVHVDFRLWINYGSRIVDLSPNVVEKQLRQQENRL